MPAEAQEGLAEAAELSPEAVARVKAAMRAGPVD